MKDINEIIDSLSPIEQNVMYNALQKRLNRGPEYTICKDEHGYYISSPDRFLSDYRFGKKEYAELAYQIYKNMKPDDSLLHHIRYVFRLLNINSTWTE